MISATEVSLNLRRTAPTNKQKPCKLNTRISTATGSRKMVHNCTTGPDSARLAQGRGCARRVGNVEALATPRLGRSGGRPSGRQPRVLWSAMCCLPAGRRRGPSHAATEAVERELGGREGHAGLGVVPLPCSCHGNGRGSWWGAKRASRCEVSRVLCQPGAASHRNSSEGNASVVGDRQKSKIAHRAARCYCSK